MKKTYILSGIAALAIFAFTLSAKPASAQVIYGDGLLPYGGYGDPCPLAPYTYQAGVYPYSLCPYPISSVYPYSSSLYPFSSFAYPYSVYPYGLGGIYSTPIIAGGYWGSGWYGRGWGGGWHGRGGHWGGGHGRGR